MSALPFRLDLTGRRVVVVGGGSLAACWVRGLADAGARVYVVAPEVAPGVVEAAAAVHRRAYRAGDLARAWLVCACTDDPGVNTAVAAEADRRRIWCLGRDDDPPEAAAPPPARRTGSVALVGGGPGAPDLITLRGRRLLAAADVVVVDRLAPRGLLAELPPGVEVIDAGKAPDAHRLTQDEINALVVARARAGQRVVRLKGGDPFLFGRGGEEALACVRAGVPYEVVPGVTSAVAVPELAGIPVTHRGLTQDVAFISGHVDPADPASDVDWAAHATGAGTLVLLMAMAHLASITAELVRRGRPGDTPAAVVSEGSTERERVLVSTLERLAEDVVAAGIRSPAVVVIGEVVRLRSALHGLTRVAAGSIAHDREADRNAS